MEFLASAPDIDDTDQVAIDHEECSICFDSLFSRQASFFLNRNKKRICRHYFHTDCVKSITNKKCCICRLPYENHKEIADPRKDPKQFFCDIDVDSSGTLSFQEITDGLKVVMPLDFRNIESDVDMFFHRWDRDNNKSISLNEFIDPKDGPMLYISEVFKTKEEKRPPPTLTRSTKVEWFQYWDEDNSNSLDKGEVVRALIKTFRFQHRDEIAAAIRGTLDCVWGIFDNDGSGHIELNEFVSNEGLGDTIIATIETL